MEKKKFKTLSKELEFASSFLPGHSSSASNSNKVAILCGGDGTGEPIFSEDCIVFNGDAKSGLDHETFAIDRDNALIRRRPNNNLVANFTKTNRKPYDLMVQISMLRLKHHFPKSEISSDGGEKEWENAKKLYTEIFGVDAPELEK